LRLYFLRVVGTFRLYFLAGLGTVHGKMTTHIDSMPALPLRRRAETPWLRRAMVFVICVVLADSLFGERGLIERTRARHDYRQAAQNLGAIRNENAGLREQIRRLQRDPATIELVAREDLGLIRPGEVVFLIKPIR